MNRHMRVVVGSVLGAASVTIVQCAPAGKPPAEDGGETVLECTADDIHHVFRIHPAASLVEDASVSPAKTGAAEVTPAEYRLLFQEPRDHYELMVRIDRASGTGTRHLFDDEQQLVKGHGGNDTLTCTERTPAN